MYKRRSWQSKNLVVLTIAEGISNARNHRRCAQASHRTLAAEIVALLDAVTDLGRLEELMIRLLHVKTWEELLDVKSTTRQPHRRRK